MTQHPPDPHYVQLAKMVKFYTGHSKMDAEQVREMLKRDYWLDASECL